MLSADILVEGVIGGGAAIGGRRAGVSTEVELARGEGTNGDSRGLSS